VSTVHPARSIPPLEYCACTHAKHSGPCTVTRVFGPPTPDELAHRPAAEHAGRFTQRCDCLEFRPC